MNLSYYNATRVFTHSVFLSLYELLYTHTTAIQRAKFSRAYRDCQMAINAEHRV